MRTILVVGFLIIASAVGAVVAWVAAPLPLGVVAHVAGEQGATIGVGAATKLYFGSAASEVSLGQAATVAGLAHAPSRDNPYAAPGRARRRRDRVLRRMQLLGYAAAGDIARARQEPLVASPRTAPFHAPHFTTRVLSWLADSDVAPNAGATIRTSLDLTLQPELESEVRHTVAVLHDR